MENKNTKSNIEGKASCLLFICSVALITIGVAFAIHGIWFSESPTRINIVLDEPTLKSDSTMYAREGIDSLMRLVANHEQALSDKYQYMLEQKEKDETMLSLGTVLVGIVLSIFGFFGYKSMKDVEARAEKIANDKSKEEAQRYLENNIGYLVDEKSRTYFESKAAKQMKKQLEEYIVQKVGEAKVDLSNEFEQETKKRKADEDDTNKLQKSESPKNDIELTSESMTNDETLAEGRNNDKDMEEMLR